MSALSLDEAMKHLNITSDDNADELQDVIDAAEAVIARKVGPLSATATTSRVEGCGRMALALPVVPVISLTSVTPTGGTAVTLADLNVSVRSGVVTGNVVPFCFFADTYTVVYQAGRASVPDDLLYGIKEMVRHMWRSQRGGSRRPGSEEQPQTPGFLIPFEVQAVIAPYELGFA